MRYLGYGYVEGVDQNGETAILPSNDLDKASCETIIQQLQPKSDMLLNFYSELDVIKLGLREEYILAIDEGIKKHGVNETIDIILNNYSDKNNNFLRILKRTDQCHLLTLMIDAELGSKLCYDDSSVGGKVSGKTYSRDISMLSFLCQQEKDCFIAKKMIVKAIDWLIDKGLKDSAFGKEEVRGFIGSFRQYDDYSIVMRKTILFMLKEVDRICSANEIDYSIASDTLLGYAVFKGLMPSTNSAQIMMTRQDYDILKKALAGNKTLKIVEYAYKKVMRTRITVKGISSSWAYISVIKLDVVKDGDRRGQYDSIKSDLKKSLAKIDLGDVDVNNPKVSALYRDAFKKISNLIGSDKADQSCGLVNGIETAKINEIDCRLEDYLPTKSIQFDSLTLKAANHPSSFNGKFEEPPLKLSPYLGSKRAKADLDVIETVINKELAGGK